jgi:hypothetical protein
MTLRPDLTPTDEELAPGIERLRKAFEPQAGDLTLLILKAHLLFEELLRDFLKKQLRHPGALQGARLTFTQVLRLCQALAATLEPDDWRWRGLIELNRLRNSIAHEIESDSSQAIVEKIVAIVGPEVWGEFPRIDQAPKRPETGATHPQAFALTLVGLYTVLAVRLGFDLNMRFVVDRERSEQVLTAIRKSNAANPSLKLTHYGIRCKPAFAGSLARTLSPNNLFKYFPVKLAAFAANSSGVPTPTTVPPPLPPSGPISISQSAVLITSRLCSMMTMVLPASRRCCSTFSSSAMSAKCRPVVGSSKM